MTASQSTLADILGDSGTGRDSERTSKTATDWSPEKRAVCRECGRDIPAKVSRVVGRDDGSVPCCDKCATSAAGREFATVTRAVQNYRDPESTVLINGGGE